MRGYKRVITTRYPAAARLELVDKSCCGELHFDNYPAFKELLGFFSEGSCGGCRKQGCLFQACGVHTCVRKKGVDFCFECNEFPCKKTNLPPAMHERWKNNNEVMKELGVEGYYERIKDLPRYP